VTASLPNIDLKLVQEFQKRAESLDDGFRDSEENIPEFLGPAVLNALGLAAFNYDFRDDGEDRAQFAVSLRDFMCVHTSGSNPLVGSMMS
jgi:hypothetical protein